MNYYSPASGTGDVVTLRAFLQQTVDHYPRLVAFSFTLEWPYRHTINDYRSLILRFHTEVWWRTGEYSRQRQQARRHSPPTVLRWIWGATDAPLCRLALMMNSDTLGGGIIHSLTTTCCRVWARSSVMQGRWSVVSVMML